MANDRDTDGVLIVPSGRFYSDPGEALKRWWAGKLVLTCTERVSGQWSSGPCTKTPKYDPDVRGIPTKCGIHCAAAKAKREAKSKERYQKWRSDCDRKRAIQEATDQLEPTLRKIAEGHNNARGLAQEVIAALDVARAEERGK